MATIFHDFLKMSDEKNPMKYLEVRLEMQYRPMFCIESGLRNDSSQKLVPRKTLQSLKIISPVWVDILGLVAEVKLHGISVLINNTNPGDKVMVRITKVGRTMQWLKSLAVNRSQSYHQYHS